MAQWLTNPTRNHEVAGLVPALAHWVEDPTLPVSCGVGCRRGSDPPLLWLWRRMMATAPIGPLAGNNHVPRERPKEIAKKKPTKNKQTKN